MLIGLAQLSRQIGVCRDATVGAAISRPYGSNATCLEIYKHQFAGLLSQADMYKMKKQEYSAGEDDSVSG